LEKGLKWLILAIVPFLALTFGGVQEWALTSMEIVLFLALSFWGTLLCIGDKKKLLTGTDNSRLFLLLFLFILLLAFQLAPLPEFLLSLISPGLTRVADMAGLKERIPFPSRISINSYKTLNALIEFTCYTFVFIFVSLSFKERGELKRAVYFLGIFGFGVSLFGIINKFTSNGKLYWLKPLTQGGSPFGPFVNHNHFAGFIIMIILPLLSLVLYLASHKTKSGGRRNDEKNMLPLLILFVSIMIVALLLTLSRGGIAGFIAGVATLLFLLFKEGEHFKRGVAVSVVAVSALALITAIGADTILARFSTLAEFYRESSFLYRLDGWKASFEAFKDFVAFGTGGGTFADIFNLYRPISMRSTFIHAHNEYVQLMVETGIAGLILLSFIVFYFTKHFNPVSKRAESRMVRYLHCGFFSGISALMVHSVVEFNLKIPSNAYLFSILAGLCVAASPTGNKKTISAVKTVLPAVVISILFVFISVRNALSTFYIEKGLTANDAAAIRGNIVNGKINPELGVRAGDFYMEKQLYKDAARCYLRTLESSPVRGIVWAKKGVAEEFAGNTDIAAKDMLTASRLDPSNNSFRLNLARLRFQEGRDEKGFAELVPLLHQPEWLARSAEMALRHDVPAARIIDSISDSHKALYAAGSYLERSGYDDFAEEAFIKAIMIAPQSPSYLDRYAQFLLNKGYLDTLTKITELFEDKVPSRALYWMAEGYYRLGEPEPAAEILSHIVEHEPDSTGYLEILAKRYLALKEYDLALAAALELLKKRGGSYAAYSVITSVYEKKGNWLKVAKYLQDAALNMPNNFDIRYRLAAAYEKLSMRKLAAAELESCLEMQPENIGARLRLAEIYLSLNRWKNAVAEFQAVLTLEPANRAVAARLDSLLSENGNSK